MSGSTPQHLDNPEKVSLSGVSETALLTLNGRARDARRPDAMIDDPMAIRLANAIDFDYAKFGPTRHDFAVRALAFDAQTRDYLRVHPKATVVALAEGLQTSFWRLDATLCDAQFRWLTVDLASIIEVRNRLLPGSARMSVRAQSALDYSWMDDVDPEHGVFITAEGFLMYLQPEESLNLIAHCAERFSGGRMIFDLPPAWLAFLARRGMWTSLRYKAPPMPFSPSAAEITELTAAMPGVRAVHELAPPRVRGRILNTILATAYRIPLLDRVRPSLTLLEFVERAKPS